MCKAADKAILTFLAFLNRIDCICTDCFLEFSWNRCALSCPSPKFPPIGTTLPPTCRRHPSRRWAPTGSRRGRSRWRRFSRRRSWNRRCRRSAGYRFRSRCAKSIVCGAPRRWCARRGWNRCSARRRASTIKTKAFRRPVRTSRTRRWRRRITTSRPASGASRRKRGPGSGAVQWPWPGKCSVSTCASTWSKSAMSKSRIAVR